MYRDNQIKFTPYGAFELKATYQRNMLLGLLSAIGLAVVVTATLLILSGSKTAMVTIPTGSEDPIIISTTPTQISVARSEPQIGPRRRPQVMSRGDIPVPVPDEDLSDLEMENVIMSSADRWALVEGSGLGPGEGEFGGEGGGSYGLADIEYRPPIDSFIAVEQQPELIHKVPPEYPRFAKDAGIEGTVVIKALIGREGDVLDAVVFVSSGQQLLDEAALAVAGKYKYRPAIQNGRPLAVWVSYKVKFALE